MNAQTITMPASMLIRKQERDLQREETGGKGWNLLRLRRLGFPVPPFVILSARMFAVCTAEHREEISGLLTDLCAKDQENITRVASRVRSLLLRITIPDSLVDDIYQGFDEIAGSDGLVSVRSSVSGEDGSDYSFAGQMDSVLNVCRSTVISAVRQVWASAFSARALAYRMRYGLPLLDIGIGVVLQRMLQAEASGVLFTRDPVSGAKECVITAGFGLGEGVVTDQVETDSYRCPIAGKEVQSVVAEKTHAMVKAHSGSSGVLRIQIPQARRTSAVLQNREVLQLRDWGLRLETAIGQPVDVEWSRAADGALFLLQVRPITTLPQNGPKLQVWDNANIVESYPGMTTPLTFSVIREAYELTFRKAIRGLLLRSTPMTQISSVFPALLGYINGRVYYNLLNWYGMLSVLPGFKRNRRAWDQMIGISHPIDISVARVSVIDRIGTLLKCTWRLLNVRGNARTFHRGFTTAYRSWSVMDIESADATALYNQYNRVAKEALLHWPRTLYNDFAAMTWYDFLKRCCTRWQCSEGLHNRLLCAEPGIESVQPVRALVRMAERIRADKTLSELFAGNSGAGILEAARGDRRAAALRRFLDDYLERYGDRGFEELKLESKSYRDDPSALIDMLKGYVESGITSAGMEREELLTRERAEKELRATMRNPFKFLVTRIVINRARAAVASRENMRFSRSRLYGLLRRMFRRLGQLFHAQHVINDADDIFFLEVDEVFAVVMKRLSPDEARDIIARRRKTYTENQAVSLPSRFIREGEDGAITLPGGTQATTDAGLRGTGCSTGIITAPCCIVQDPRDAGDVCGKILVARSTDPGWVFLMINAAGLIVEQGSVLSHTAIIGRELGIPTIVAAKDAMLQLADARDITMNGATGEIQWK